MASSMPSTAKTTEESWIFLTNVPSVIKFHALTTPPKGQIACKEAVLGVNGNTTPRSAAAPREITTTTQTKNTNCTIVRIRIRFLLRVFTLFLLL